VRQKYLVLQIQFLFIPLVPPVIHNYEMAYVKPCAWQPVHYLDSCRMATVLSSQTICSLIVLQEQEPCNTGWLPRRGGIRSISNSRSRSHSLTSGALPTWTHASSGPSLSLLVPHFATWPELEICIVNRSKSRKQKMRGKISQWKRGERRSERCKHAKILRRKEEK
jgi:hypothetical protein